LSSNAKYQARGGAKDGLRHRDLRDLLAKKIVRREVLYSDFITERARLLVDALEQERVLLGVGDRGEEHEPGGREQQHAGEHAGAQ